MEAGDYGELFIAQNLKSLTSLSIRKQLGYSEGSSVGDLGVTTIAHNLRT